ncbi:MAG: hypothetical protein NT166_11410 [Candidatus Aminicenantes bacterium]|nr:hypothetical protein [Candidatus Aminicenantes bacterium]
MLLITPGSSVELRVWFTRIGKNKISKEAAFTPGNLAARKIATKARRHKGSPRGREKFACPLFRLYTGFPGKEKELSLLFEIKQIILYNKVVQGVQDNV